MQDVQRTLDTTLAQFRQTLTEYTAVMTNVSQIATQTSTMVTSAMGATHAIKQAGEATERTAQLAVSQVESFQAVVGNMQRYEEIFSRVEVTSEKLLGQIEQHLHNLPLSQKRSMAVVRESLDVLSKSTADASAPSTLRACFLTFLSASGRGSSDPIQDPITGMEAPERSRRVVFKIRVRSLEQRQVQEALGIDVPLQPVRTP